MDWFLYDNGFRMKELRAHLGRWVTSEDLKSLHVHV